jgi:hypothetical protein
MERIIQQNDKFVKSLGVQVLKYHWSELLRGDNLGLPPVKQFCAARLAFVGRDGMTDQQEQQLKEIQAGLIGLFVGKDIEVCIHAALSIAATIAHLIGMPKMELQKKLMRMYDERVAEQIPCPDCKGIGAPWNNSSSVPCRKCRGTGRVLGTANEQPPEATQHAGGK